MQYLVETLFKAELKFIKEIYCRSTGYQRTVETTQVCDHKKCHEANCIVENIYEYRVIERIEDAP